MEQVATKDDWNIDGGRDGEARVREVRFLYAAGDC